MKIKKWFGLIIIIIIIAGCAPVDQMTKRNTVGQPPAYVDGYHDGCGSGYVASGHPYAKASKNVQRYLKDEVYKVGWDDGFATCKGDYDAIHAMGRRF